MKKVFVPVAIAAIVCVGGYFAKSSTTPDNGLSDIQLRNAEALADEESGSLEYPTGYPYITKCNSYA